MNTQLIIQKVFSSDTKLDSKPVYQIGLIVYRKSVSSDDFMLVGGQIVFDDNAILVFNDHVYTNYLYSGKHEFSLKHTLTESELQAFQNKKIDFFRVYQYENKLDKWQKENVLKAFNTIVSEQ